MRITGRLVLITGASSGIGAETARLVARRGGRVLLLARTRGALDAVAADIRKQGGEAGVYPVDLSDPVAVDRITAAIAREAGTPDVLVNNAGAGRWRSVEETTTEEAAQMMAVPYLAAFGVTRAFLPSMRARGSGHIVNMSSVVGYVGIPGAAGYATARWAMRGFTEALRADLAGTGIGVTLIAPGKVDSPFFAHNPGSEERIPGIARLYRTLSTEEVAAAVVRAVERNQREVVMPALLKLTILTHRVLPRLVQGLLVRTGWRPSG